MAEVTLVAWQVYLAAHPGAHVLQTAAWAELKAAFGWEPVPVLVGEAGALVLFRRLPLGLTMGYIPRGPLGLPAAGWEKSTAFWQAVDAACRRRHCVFLKAEPDCWQEAQPQPPAGWVASPHPIQPPRTIVVDLQGDEETLLQRMKPKARYNIRLAAKKGIQVQPSRDIQAFYRLMQATGERDAFGVHSLAYYQRAYELFQPRGECELLLATYETEPLAALMVFARGERAWYVYGASSNRHRERMPTYLLQWETMRWARNRGCREYDLWGVPDEDEAALEAGFETRSDGLWGVYRNKRGFGGRLLRSAGPWDRVYRPWLYRAYVWWAGRARSGA